MAAINPVEYLLEKRDWVWSTIRRTRYSEPFTRPSEPCSAYELDPKATVTFVESEDGVTVTATFYLPLFDIDIKVIGPRDVYETRKLGRTSQLTVHGVLVVAGGNLSSLVHVSEPIEYFMSWNIHEVVHAFVTKHPGVCRHFFAISGVSGLIKTYIGTTHYADFEVLEEGTSNEVALQKEIFPWLSQLAQSQGHMCPSAPDFAPGPLCNLKPTFALCRFSNELFFSRKRPRTETIDHSHLE